MNDSKPSKVSKPIKLVKSSKNKAIRPIKTVKSVSKDKAKAKISTLTPVKGLAAKKFSGKVKTKKGIDRRIPHPKHPPKRKSIKLKASTGKQKLAAKQYRQRRKLRETPLDKKIDSLRAKHLRSLRAKPKGLSRQATVNSTSLKIPVSNVTIRPAKVTKPKVKPKMTAKASPGLSLAALNPSSKTALHSLLKRVLTLRKLR